jgi:hypothetical protein
MKVKMAINKRRAERMARRSDAELVRFVHAKTLSSAAAYYALEKRGKLSLLAKEVR